MEKYQYPDLQRLEDTSQKRPTHDERLFRRQEIQAESEKIVDMNAIIQDHLKEKARKAARRKWGGRGLIVLGTIIILTSCPLYAFSLIGPQTLLTGLAMMVGGSALLTWKPRLKDHNEAIIVAAKYGNCLTATRLALELDVSIEKAERIIQELARSGIAEIDLDHKDSDHSIVYRVRGL
jgi:hypothetical protein